MADENVEDKQEVTGSCERCRANDGRRTKLYEVGDKPGKREFCDDCARLTAEAHKLKPRAPKSDDADPNETQPKEPSTPNEPGQVVATDEQGEGTGAKAR